MEFLSEYGLFLAKWVTVVIALGIIIGMIASVADKSKKHSPGHLEITHLNAIFQEINEQLRQSISTPAVFKAFKKQQKKQDKEKAKNKSEDDGKKVFVIDFKGDIRASQVKQLREEVTAILGIAQPQDEVVVRLESGGGVVHGYGLASSQLDRIKKKGIPLTVCVDKVAASGGYMMACVADKVVSAPFAMLGSIGVVAQLPNFHRLLNKNDIDFEMLTAGEYKRTLTLFGENTEKGREKFIEDLEETHQIFKDFVATHRPEMELEKIATGEVWLGEKAIHMGLIDELATSDEYLVNMADQAEVYEIRFVARKSLQEKVGLAAESSIDGIASRLFERVRELRFFT